jgi:citrate lyase beta subunit
MVEKAVSSGADLVVADLEDAVGGSRRDDARRVLPSLLEAHPELAVRVSLDGRGVACAADVAAFDGHPPSCVVLPKASSSSVLASIAIVGSELPLIGLVETARGLLDIAGMPAYAGLVRLALGSADLQADTGLALDDPAVSQAVRVPLAIASRGRGFAPPIDGPHLDLQDLAGLSAACSAARSAGFGGKICIHPRQVTPVNAAFTPSAKQVAEARELLDAANGRTDDGAFSYGGAMVDAPVVEAARRVVALALALDGLSGS